MVPLWQLLLLISMVMPLGAAVASATLAGRGFPGYGLATIVGFTVGVLSAGAMLVIRKVALRKLVPVNQRLPDEMSSDRRAWYFRAWYFSMMVWIVFSWVVATCFSRLLLRVIF